MKYRNGQHGVQTGPDATWLKVLASVRDRAVDGATTHDVSRDVGIGYTGARYHLKRLKARGFVTETGVRRPDAKGQRREKLYWATLGAV
jgi:predicted ArsR family transcriptional regulator